MKAISPENEFALLERIALGDKEAFAYIYTFYTPKLYRFLYPFTNQSKEETEETIQEIFLKIWMRRERLICLRSFEQYLFRMAKNQLIDTRKRVQHLRLIKNELQPAQEESMNDLHDNLVYSEYYQAAKYAVQNLTPQRKKIFEMRTQNDMAIAEIACELNITQSAVKKQLYEAINSIKQHLHQETGWPLLFLLITWLS